MTKQGGVMKVLRRIIAWLKGYRQISPKRTPDIQPRKVAMPGSERRRAYEKTKGG